LRIHLRAWQSNGRRTVFCTLFLLLTTILLTLLLPPPASAVGTFINAPDRIDMVYDDARGVLYITNGGEVLRYKLSTDSFLSPFTLGGSLMGIDLSPDGNTLAVADAAFAGIHVIDLLTETSEAVSGAPGGTWTVAFGNDGKALISSRWDWVPLAQYDPTAGTISQFGLVYENTMLKASADGSVIGFAESNRSDGAFGRYRVSDGDMLSKQGYADGTSWFNYEIGVSRHGTQYAIPTYGGTFITDANLAKYAVVGDYAGGQPIGVVYHPTKRIVYFAWATTPYIYAYDSGTLAPIAGYDFENTFYHPGNHAFTQGRLKISRAGNILFATVGGGVRYYAPPPINMPPITTLVATPDVPDGDDGWYTTNPSITITADDVSATAFYSWDTSSSFGEYSGPFGIGAQGIHDLYYYSASDGSTETIGNRQFKVDTDAPINPIVASPSHRTDTLSNSKIVDISLSGATDTVSGVEGYAYTWSENTTEEPEAFVDIPATNTTESFTSWLYDGAWWLNLKTRDKAGNWASTVHLGPFMIDGPPETFLFPWPFFPDGENGWYVAPPDIWLIADETATTSYQWDSTDSAGWVSALGWVAEVGVASEGRHTLNFFSVDLSDQSESLQSQEFAVDLRPPTNPAVLSPSHAAGGWSNNKTVNLNTLGATDSASGVDGFSFTWSTDANKWPDKIQNGEANLAETSSGLLADGYWYFHLRTKDIAGNWSDPIHLGPFKIETTKPIGSIAINAGVVATASSASILNLSAADAESGVIRMRFKNSGGSWSAWRPYATSTSWDLEPRDGPKVVFAQFRDAAGNESTAVSDEIILDTIAPSASIVAPRISSSVAATPDFPISWSGKDGGALPSGVASYDIDYKIGTAGGWRNWLRATKLNSAGFKGIAGKTYYLRARSRDRAGNVSAWSAAKKTIVPYDETALGGRKSGFIYTFSEGLSSFYLGTIRYSLQRGDTAIYKFRGNFIALISMRAPNRAKAKIYIDNKYVKTINTYSPDTQARSIVFEASFSKVRTHRLEIVNQGRGVRNRFDIDAFAVGR